MSSRSRGTVWLLAAATIVVPWCCVYLGDFVFWHLTERPQRVLEDPGNALVQACLTGAAFLFFTLFAIAKQALRHLSRREARALRVALLVGTLISVLVWLVYYWEGYIYWRDRSIGGADIGLGVLMLALPLLAGIPMGIGYAWSMRPKGP